MDNMHTDPLAQRNRELSILHEIAEALNRTTDLDDILYTALNKLSELFDLPTAWLWLIDDKTQESRLAAALNLPPALQNYPARMEGLCYCLDTFRNGDLDGAANINVITCSRLKYLQDTDGLLYHTSIPLYANEKKLGVLNVASTGWRELSADELRILHTIGDMLSMAIERAQLFLTSKNIGAVEERTRLAREIHDTLAQGLAAIAMKLETTEMLFEKQHENMDTKEHLKSAIKLTQQTLEDARKSVLDLRSESLEGPSLLEALRHLAENYQKTWNLEIRILDKTGGIKISGRKEFGLFRIAQEALINILKHASARSVEISVEILNDRVEMAIQDDGSGFEIDDTELEGHGLIGINERANLLGGTFEIQTSRGSGTKLITNIPLIS